jgi:tetratricopeptide (TPR) repeat protein
MTGRASARRVLVLVCALLSACTADASKNRAFDQGKRLLEANKPREAIVELQNAIDSDEFWGEARYLLAEAYAAAGEPESAQRQYVRAADLLPDDDTAQIKAARYLSFLGQHTDAKTRAERVLARSPKNIEAQIALGNALAGLRDVDGALAQITEAIQLDPSRSDTYANLALIRVAQGHQSEAREAFERAVTISDTSVPARLALANFQWSNGEVEAAEASLQRAYKIDAKNLLTNRVLATFYLASGRPERAEEFLKVAADIADTTAAKLTLADYYITYRRYDDARRVLEPLAGQPLDRPAVEIRLANLEYVTGKQAEGHRRLDAILKQEPNDAAALVQKARWLLAEGRTERALQRAQSAVSVSPRSIAAYYLRAEAEVRTRRLSQAADSYSQILKLNPRAADAQVHLSRLHLTLNELDSAVLFAEEAVANAPDYLDARLALVRAWIARGDVGYASNELAALKQQHAGVADVWTVEGLLRMAGNDLARAGAAFARALQISPDSFDALTGLTRVEVLRGEAKQAAARLAARLKPDERNPDMLLLTARAALAANDPATAERVLRQSITVDPWDTANFALLAGLLAQQKRLESATREFDEAAAREPNNIAWSVMAAVLVHAQGNLSEAMKRYDAIVKSEPRAAIAANNLAAIYAERGEHLDHAQQLAEAAARLLPADAEVRDTLGWIYYQRHEVGRAIQQFLHSAAAEPNNAVYQYHLGLAYAKNREPERAREALKRAVSLNPRLVDARKALAALDAPPS